MGQKIKRLGGTRKENIAKTFYANILNTNNRSSRINVELEIKLKLNYPRVKNLIKKSTKKY
jgi:hypothetical protein